MTVYTTALLIHVLGAITFFTTLGMEWAAVLHLHRAATVAQVRERMDGLALLPRLYIPAVVAILMSGLYMTATTWGWGASWPTVAVAAMVVLAVLGATLTLGWIAWPLLWYVDRAIEVCVALPFAALTVRDVPALAKANVFLIADQDRLSWEVGDSIRVMEKL